MATTVEVHTLPAESADLLRQAMTAADLLARAVEQLQGVAFRVGLLEGDHELTAIRLNNALVEAKEARRDAERAVRSLSQGE